MREQTTDFALDMNGCLAAIGRLTRELELRASAYCHWKSNEHLYAAVAGDTDLDVLFEEKARPRVLEALAAAGFRRGRAVWHRRYPFIEDYLAVDAATGKLVHVHAHFRLLVGEESVKNFHLPWEAELLETCHWDGAAGFFAAEPARELLLLLVRSAIKRRYPSLHRRLARQSRPVDISDAQREFEWLKARVPFADLRDVAARLLGAQAVPAIEALYERGIDAARLSALYDSGRVRRFLRRGPLTAWCSRWLRWTAGFSAILARRLGLIGRPHRRTLPGGGLIVAVLGADGSGKSTLVKALDAALSKKIDVVRLYLGSGDGPVSLWRWPLAQLRRRRQQRKASPSPSSAPGEGRTRKRPALWRFLVECERIAWAVTLLFERRAKLRAASRARASGRIVVTDRYPQSTIEGYNDGPLLGDLATSAFWPLRVLSRWEREGFLPERMPQPDLVLKLVGSPDVLHGRRADMAVAVIAAKQKGILDIAFGAGTRVVRLDADRPAAQVLAAAMAAVGTVLSAAPADDPARDGDAEI